MCKWASRCSYISVVSCRFYTQKVRGPLASNKDLLAGLKDVKHELGERKDDAQYKDGRNGLQDTAKIPAIQSQLPQSPLMFRYLGRRSPQAQLPKPQQQQKELSPFQEKLQANIYAHALASPVRMCRLTSTRLPSDFLIQHGVSTHPGTGKKWSLPTLAGRLAQQEKHKRKRDAESSSSSRAEHQPERLDALPPRKLSGFNILSSYKALDLVSKGQSSKKHRELLPQSWKENNRIGKDLIWREDMADFTLDLMRKEIIAQMQSTLKTKKSVDLSSYDSWEVAQAQTHVSSVLCMSNDPKESDVAPLEYVQCLSEGSASDINSWTMAVHRKRRIPVFFMKTLLGSEYLATIRELWPEVLGRNFVVIGKSTSTVDLQGKLWKLVGFLA